jgi:AraC-like DNA-binding protein
LKSHRVAADAISTSVEGVAAHAGQWSDKGSPVAVAQTRRVLLARQLIHETHLPMTEVAFAAGFGSVRRFNETFLALLSRAPGDLRRASTLDVSAGRHGEIGLSSLPTFTLGPQGTVAVQPADGNSSRLCRPSSRGLEQITVSAAVRLTGRLVAAHGERLAEPDGDLTHVFPRPEALAAADLTSLGMPRSRAAALSAVAAAALADTHLFDATSGLDDAVRRLRLIRGVGEWTAQYIALRQLREPDAFPAAGLMRAIASRERRGHS